MVLSGRQREELNKAIAEYLGANGYLNTLSEFQKEADLNSAQDVEKKFVGESEHFCLILVHHVPYKKVPVAQLLKIIKLSSKAEHPGLCSSILYLRT